MQTAFDDLESEVNRKRAASTTASRGDATGPVEGASDNAISDPSVSSPAESHTETFNESQRSSEAVRDQGAASSSSAADAQHSKHGNAILTCTHLAGDIL